MELFVINSLLSACSEVTAAPSHHTLKEWATSYKLTSGDSPNW